MKYKKIVLTIVSFIVILVISIIYIFTRPCNPPERVNNIPSNAFWVGGCDGGLWYDLTSVKQNIYAFTIYNDYTGEIVTSGEFKINNECYSQLKNQNIKDLITHSNTDKIYLSLTFENKYCYLEKIIK